MFTTCHHGWSLSLPVHEKGMRDRVSRLILRVGLVIFMHYNLHLIKLL